MCVHMHLSPSFDWRLRDSGFQTNVVTQFWHGQPTRRGHSHFQQNWGDYRPAPSNETDSNGMPTLQVNVHRACFCLGSFHSLLEGGGEGVPPNNKNHAPASRMKTPFIKNLTFYEHNTFSPKKHILSNRKTILSKNKMGVRRTHWPQTK